MDSTQQSQRLGYVSALSAYVFWGFAPFYFKAIPEVDPWEIIAHRVIWAVPVMALFLLYRDGWGWIRKLRLPPRLILGLLLSGVLVSTNWLIFVWAVVNDRVLSTSLGYFINPLVNVLLGFLFLRERLTPNQAAAVGLAAIGTVYLAWFLGEAPWVSLALGLTFGLYGLTRKRLLVGPMTGLMWEVLLLFPAALLFMGYRGLKGSLDFLHIDAVTDGLLLAAGLITVLPLIMFNRAAQILPLSILGLFMYIAPSMTFILAILVWNEPFTQGHGVAFVCIWTALIMITIESWRRARRLKRLGRDVRV